MLWTIAAWVLAATLAAGVFFSIWRFAPRGGLSAMLFGLIAAAVAAITFIVVLILSLAIFSRFETTTAQRGGNLTATSVAVVETPAVACPQGQVCIPAATAAWYATVVAKGGSSAPTPTATNVPPTATSAPISTPVPTVGATTTTPPTTPAVMPVTETHLGLNRYGGAQVSLPTAPAGPDQLYVAHGDVDGTGTCHVWVWESGKVSGLSRATWQLYLVTGGSRADRMAVVTNKQRAAAATSGTCPMVTK